MDVLARFKRWPKVAQVVAASTVLVVVIGGIAGATTGSSATSKTSPTTSDAELTATTPTTEKGSPPTTEIVLAPGQIDRAHPSSSLTPGDIFPAATTEAICEPGYSKSVRDVDDSMRDRVFAAYRVDAGDRRSYQLDHLVALELGGSNDERNLWPQPLSSTSEDGAHDKDVVENQLHAAVCSGHVDLASAQTAIVHWDTTSIESLPAPSTTTSTSTTTA